MKSKRVRVSPDERFRVYTWYRVSLKGWWHKGKSWLLAQPCLIFVPRKVLIKAIRLHKIRPKGPDATDMRWSASSSSSSSSSSGKACPHCFDFFLSLSLSFLLFNIFFTFAILAFIFHFISLAMFMLCTNSPKQIPCMWKSYLAINLSLLSRPKPMVQTGL